MCRFFIYKGNTIKLEYLFNTSNSILKQSINEPNTPFLKKRNMRDHEINGDGFGISWEKEKDSFLYKSIKPSWNDVNINNLSKYINSNLYFCHVRAIKPFSCFSCVHEHNCHPFKYNNFLWMHNGDIKNKVLLCKYLYDNVDLKLLSNIKGNTDSEYCFFIFLSLLDKDVLNNKKKMTQNEMKDKLIECIKIITSITKEIVSLNLSVYDGSTIICTRYINDINDSPPSLYYSKNIQFQNKNNSNIVISSEPVNNNYADWNLIPKNSLLILTKNNNIILKKINIDLN
jgi:predicted glutamine amidotransferase